MAGYTSVRDMFDGGGPGVSGGAYSGGGALSAAANKVTGQTATGTSSVKVGSNLPGAIAPRRQTETQAQYETRRAESNGGTLVAGKDLAFATANPATTISEADYRAGKMISILGGPVGLASSTIVELQKRGILPASGGNVSPEQRDTLISGSGGSDTDKQVQAVIADASLTDAEKNLKITDLLKGSVNATLGQTRADIGINTVNPMLNTAYGTTGATKPSAVFDNPQNFLDGMSLSDSVPMMDANAPGTVVNGADPRFAMDPAANNVAATVISDVATANPVQTGQVSTYDAALSADAVAQNGQATAQQGVVSNEAKITAEQLDAQGTATGTNADGSVNFTGQALNKPALQGLQVIDTSTTAGRLLAQELGEGNYTDAKATMSGQLEILQKQFIDPATGEAKIPSWASGVARNVSRIAAFSGMTGTAATAAMANALLEASMPIAQQDSAFFQTLTTTNLNNRQQMAVQKAQVLANLDLANMDARMTAAVENSKAFLQMDLTNLENRQQTEIVNTQARVQSIFEDAKATNASRLFAAESANDFTKFYDQLNTQVQQFNANAVNNMAQFNTGEINNTAQFNASMETQREQFYKEMQYNIDLANARWRQTVTTANTEMKFEAARTDVQNMVNLSTEAMSRMWDREDAILDYTFKSTEGELDRQVQIYAADRNYELGKRELKGKEDAAFGAGLFEVANMAGKFMDWW